MLIKKTFQGSLPDNKIVNTHSNSQTDTYSCDYLNNKLNPEVFDGTGVFGWYSTATSGEDLTANYDVTPSDIYNLQVGSKWEWPSRVQTGATNTGMPYYMTSYSARTSNWDLYYVKYVSMNGNYYEYAYDDINVYKEVYPDGGGVACFAKDTKVWTKEGTKDIKDIQVGDKVLSYNWCKDKVDYYPVEEIFSHSQEKIYCIELENGNKIYATGDHPMVEKENSRVPACALKEGHVLVDNKGQEYSIKANKEITYNDTVYEIHMEGEVLNYFVGDDKIMVFNEVITGETE